jgi:hypothetical protein
MDEPGPDHFEMRRLESLSNTIFGVAMTPLAYDLRARRNSARRPPGARFSISMRRGAAWQALAGPSNAWQGAKSVATEAADGNNNLCL